MIRMSSVGGLSAGCLLWDGARDWTSRPAPHPCHPIARGPASTSRLSVSAWGTTASRPPLSYMGMSRPECDPTRQYDSAPFWQRLGRRSRPQPSRTSPYSLRPFLFGNVLNFSAVSELRKMARDVSVAKTRTDKSMPLTVASIGMAGGAFLLAVVWMAWSSVREQVSSLSRAGRHSAMPRPCRQPWSSPSERSSPSTSGRPRSQH